MDYPRFPSYPISPMFPAMPDMPVTGKMPSVPGVAKHGTLGDTFSSLMSKVSSDVGAPSEMAQQMLNGERKFDLSELMLTILDAENKLNVTVRILNETIKGIKEIERIQA